MWLSPCRHMCVKRGRKACWQPDHQNIAQPNSHLSAQNTCQEIQSKKKEISTMPAATPTHGIPLHPPSTSPPLERNLEVWD